MTQTSEIPKVSIIIPVFNGSNFLSQAIDSALSQSYKNFEVIVVNDGSSDNGLTSNVALSYGNKIRYFEKENGGISTALNKGIMEMTGEYFSWLSHDDMYFPGKIETQVNFLMKHPEFKACYCNYEVIDGNNNVKDRIVTPYYPRIDAIKTLLGHGYINGCTMLINRECFNEVGMFNPSLLYTQDIEMWIRILNTYEIARIDDFLVSERHHTTQTSITKRKKMLEETLQMYVDIFERLDLSRIISKPLTDELSKAAGYLWLGDRVALTRGGYHISDSLYRKSLSNWNSIKNPAWIRGLIGARLFFKLKKISRRN